MASERVFPGNEDFGSRGRQSKHSYYLRMSDRLDGMEEDRMGILEELHAELANVTHDNASDLAGLVCQTAESLKSIQADMDAEWERFNAFGEDEDEPRGTWRKED